MGRQARSVKTLLWGTAAAGLALTRPGAAADLPSVEGFSLRWDNTIRYTAAFRLAGRDAALIADPNEDDGDRNFSPGLVSNRFDLLSEFDVTHEDFGGHVSAAAWYDTVYHTHTDNTSPATYNPASVPNTKFARAVRDLHGQHLELHDAFVFANAEFGDTALSVRAGRQTVIWGESLFFSANSIAAAQAPRDEILYASAPGSYSRSLALPVSQISASLQFPSGISLDGYYQFEWRASREPGSGSYFSYFDYLGAGGQRLIVSPGQYLYHSFDVTPPSTGQYGVALHVPVFDVDLGVYVLRFHAKDPILKLWPTWNEDPSIGKIGEYGFVYPGGIDLYGLSASGRLGENTIAGEISLRRHMPLVSIGSGYGPGSGVDLANSGYAAGNTFHAQVSSTAVFADGIFWDRADFSIELAMNALLDVTHGSEARDTSRDRMAFSGRVQFEPSLFEVLPNLTVTLPMGLGLNLAGQSSVDERQIAGTGDVEVGVSLTYRTVWKMTTGATFYLGPADRQPLADRHFLTISIERTL